MRATARRTARRCGWWLRETRRLVWRSALPWTNARLSMLSIPSLELTIAAAPALPAARSSTACAACARLRASITNKMIPVAASATPPRPERPGVVALAAVVLVHDLGRPRLVGGSQAASSSSFACFLPSSANSAARAMRPAPVPPATHFQVLSRQVANVAPVDRGGRGSPRASAGAGAGAFAGGARAVAGGVLVAAAADAAYRGSPASRSAPGARWRRRRPSRCTASGSRAPLGIAGALVRLRHVVEQRRRLGGGRPP